MRDGYKLVQVALPESLVKRLKVYTVKHDQTMSDFVTQAVADRLQEHAKR